MSEGVLKAIGVKEPGWSAQRKKTSQEKREDLIPQLQGKPPRLTLWYSEDWYISGLQGMEIKTHSGVVLYHESSHGDDDRIILYNTQRTKLKPNTASLTASKTPISLSAAGPPTKAAVIRSQNFVVCPFKYRDQMLKSSLKPTGWKLLW